MGEESIRREWEVQKVARKERLDRREQVNRIKGEAVYLGLGQSVRLQELRARREAAGLTQWRLAKMIGTNQTTISELEERYARRGAYLFTIRRLCEVLKSSPVNLICKYLAPEEGTQGSYRMERATRRKGLKWKGQLNALRKRAWYVPKDRMTEGGWKVRLPGLKACRLAARIAQGDLAKLVGKSQTTIAGLENGSGAYISTMRRLCRTLKVLPADLICKGPVK